MSSINHHFQQITTTFPGGLWAQRDIVFGPWLPQGVSANLTANSALAQSTSKRADATTVALT